MEWISVTERLPEHMQRIEFESLEHKKPIIGFYCRGFMKKTGSITIKQYKNVWRPQKNQ